MAADAEIRQPSRARACLAAVVLVVFGVAPALAERIDHEYTEGEWLSVGGIAATAAQCQNVVKGEDGDDDCSGTLVVQPEASLRPTERDEVFVKLGFASSNLLNNRTPLAVSPWAADLEDDVENVNDTSRDYLLTAWYRHAFSYGEDSSLGIVAGLIDATDLLDENAYANDEFTQFMNSALVNGPNTFLPSYDPGAAVDWHVGEFSLHGVYMSVDSEISSGDTAFYALQFGWHPENRFGSGNYRLILTRTGRGFANPEETDEERRQDIILSADQQLGDTLGVYARVEFQEDNAAVLAESTWSAGMQSVGTPWGREQDTVGLGVIYAHGGNLELRDGYNTEAYYRYAFSDALGVSGSVQYGYGDIAAPEDVEVWTFGLRFTAEF